MLLRVTFQVFVAGGANVAAECTAEPQQQAPVGEGGQVRQTTAHPGLSAPGVTVWTASPPLSPLHWLTIWIN